MKPILEALARVEELLFKNLLSIIISIFYTVEAAFPTTSLLKGLALARKAAMDIAGTVITFGVAAIALLIVILIFYNVEVALPTTDLSAAGQSKIATVVTTAGSGWSLLTISLIVLAAVVILGTLMLLRG